MQNTKELLIPEATYHVYNRANGSEKLFYTSENYRYFLKKIQTYISPIAETFCYCLMPNHFHFLIRIKNEKELSNFYKKNFGFDNADRVHQTFEESKKPEIFSKLLSQQFSHLFNGYTQALNKQNNRKGGLFMRPFKRKRVHDKKYLLKLVHYIHFNPIESKLCDKPDEWNYSSYRKILTLEKDFLNSIELVDWFEDIENFVVFHSTTPKDTESIKEIIL